MRYGNDVFQHKIGYDHPVYGCPTEDMDTDEKCDALLELINDLEWRISEQDKKIENLRIKRKPRAK